MRDLATERTARDNDVAGSAGDGRRPALLLRTAVLGRARYRRARDLPRILGAEPPIAAPARLAALAAVEWRHEQTRRQGTGGYAPAAHVAALIALLAERAALAGAAAQDVSR